MQTASPIEFLVDYCDDPLLLKSSFQAVTMERIATASLALEQALGGPQDVEGVLTSQGTLYIVQSRPQV